MKFFSRKHAPSLPRRPKVRASRRRMFGAECLEPRQLLATLYVATSGSDSGSGGASSPYQSLQLAVTRANSGDTIEVAAGTYTYQASADHFGPSNQFSYTSALGASSVVALMGKSVTIEGGFTTSNWAVPDASANPTIIDGQGTHRGIFAIASSNDSSPTSLALENITVQNCLAAGITTRSGADAVYGFGGGLFADLGSAQNETAPWVFQNDVFRNNTAQASGALGDEGGRGAGGAVALRYVNSTTFNNVVFDSNHAVGANGSAAGGGGLGGAIHLDHSNMTGTALTFTNNVARAGSSASGSGTGSDGETADALGGAMAAILNSTIKLDGVTATGNQALGGAASGKGGSGFGGAFYAEESSVTYTVADALFQGNLAQGGNGGTGGLAGGGAVMTYNASLGLDRSLVIANVAKSGGSTNGGATGATGGGGLYLTLFSGSSTTTVNNSVIADNMAVAGPGSGPAGGGGGVFFQGVTATLTQDTLDNNQIGPGLTYGQSLLLISGTSTSSTVNLADSIVSDETSTTGGAIEVFSGNKINFNTDLSFNNAAFLSNLTTSGGYTGLGTVNMVGASAALPTLYNSPGSPHYDFHLNRGVANPAVEGATGSTATVDLDGNPRQGTPDLGAYEAISPRIDLVGPISVGEGGVAQVTLSRRGDISQAASVQLAIVPGGTAVEGTDYQSIGAGDVVTVTFAPYVASQTVSLQSLADAANTAGRTVNLAITLVANTPARLGASTATVTILSSSGSGTQTGTGFDVTSVGPIASRRGITGAVVQFNASLTTTTKVGRRVRAINLLPAFSLSKISGGKIPRVVAVKYNAGTNSMTVRFSGPIPKGSSASLNLQAGRLLSTGGQALSGTTGFTLTA